MITVGKHIIQVLVVQITNVNVASQQRCFYKGVLFNVLSMDGVITVGKHIIQVLKYCRINKKREKST